jgi:hypothetical protein
LVPKHRPHLIVANRGIHYVADEIVLAELNETFTYLDKHHPGTS